MCIRVASTRATSGDGGGRGGEEAARLVNPTELARARDREKAGLAERKVCLHADGSHL